MADFYELLGVGRGASADELKRAYRRLARELHPDANPGDAAAEERFKQVARAYEVLSDPEARARYDRFGEAGVGGAGGAAGDNFTGAGFGDIFEAFFGGGGPFGSARGPAGPPRGQDLEVVAEVSFEEAVFGASVSTRVRTALRCVECGGSGASAGTEPVTCSECHGRGQVQRVRQSMLGQMVTSTVCGRCSGYGSVIVTPCPGCAAEGRIVTDHTYDVDVPAGVDTGTTLRLTGRGAVGPRGGSAGDLYVHLRVRPHEQFRRDGDDLVTDLEISYPQAALGASFTLATLDGDEVIVVPPGTQPGREFVLRQRGVPRLHGRGRGDLRVRAVVTVPTRLSEQETELLKALAAARGDEVLAEQGLFARIKSAFQ